MRVEDLTKFEGECPNIVVFGTYMDIRVPLTKKWKKIINERGDKPNTYHNCLISYISEQIAYLFVEKYGRVMGEHYYNKFVHEFDGNILKMVGYFRGSEKEGQVFCDMITERIEKYEKRMSYDKGKLNN
jgi:hypothetical protein